MSCSGSQLVSGPCTKLISHSRDKVWKEQICVFPGVLLFLSWLITGV